MPETGPVKRTPPTVPTLDGGPLARWLAPSSESRVERIPVASILPRPIADHNDGDAASFAALVASVRARGIVEPLLLRPAPGGAFVVVCGARRLRAARHLGVPVVPAIVRELGDVEMLLTGAWQALLRIGITAASAPALESRLIAGGLQAAEAAALVAAIPRRETDPVPVAQRAPLPELRYLRTDARTPRPGHPGHHVIPLAVAPWELMFPREPAILALLADALPPTGTCHMAA